MLVSGKISENQAKEAAAVGMGNRLSDTYVSKSDDYKYPSYFDAVINEAISTYGLSEKDIVNNGYKIYTELDQNYQTGMDVSIVPKTSPLEVSTMRHNLLEAQALLSNP